MWPDNRLRDLLGLDVPIVQAPMAGAFGDGGGGERCGWSRLTALRGTGWRQDQGGDRRDPADGIDKRQFLHPYPPDPDLAADAVWRDRLRDLPRRPRPRGQGAGVNRAPFDAATCEIVEDSSRRSSFSLRSAGDGPAAGRPPAQGAEFRDDSRRGGVAAARGCDAIAGIQAGGNRGTFARTFSPRWGRWLVPQVVDAVDVPVIAAGGIADGRGIAAAFVLGASGVRSAPPIHAESLISDLHREAWQCATTRRR